MTLHAFVDGFADRFVNALAGGADSRGDGSSYGQLKVLVDGMAAALAAACGACAALRQYTVTLVLAWLFPLLGFVHVAILIRFSRARSAPCALVKNPYRDRNSATMERSDRSKLARASWRSLFYQYVKLSSLASLWAG